MKIQTKIFEFINDSEPKRLSLPEELFGLKVNNNSIKTKEVI